MTRPYDNAGRAAAARRAQERVIETAHRLLLERGWALDEFERWFAASLAAALLPAPA